MAKKNKRFDAKKSPAKKAAAKAAQLEGENVNNALDNDATDEEVSKSQIKREMHYLQNLGTQLLTVKAAELEKLALAEALLFALTEAKRIKHREGLRRQMQFIGKLMRKESAETIANIEALFDRLNNQHHLQNQHHHLIEQWRDRILQDNNEIESFIDAYPTADRQWLRQTARQSAQETSRDKPPASARKLFIYIRDTLAKHPVAQTTPAKTNQQP